MAAPSEAKSLTMPPQPQSCACLKKIRKKGDNGRQQETTGDNGKRQLETTGDNGRQQRPVPTRSFWPPSLNLRLQVSTYAAKTTKATLDWGIKLKACSGRQ